MEATNSTESMPSDAFKKEDNADMTTSELKSVSNTLTTQDNSLMNEEVGAEDILNKLRPQIRGQWTPADVASIFPENLLTDLREGITFMGTKLAGFSGDEGLVYGVETRTSSPLRMLRDERLQSPAIKGVYPCGEGAGFAGGIMSAAVDGMKVAEKILEFYND